MLPVCFFLFLSYKPVRSLTNLPIDSSHSEARFHSQTCKGSHDFRCSFVRPLSVFVRLSSTAHDLDFASQPSSRISAQRNFSSSRCQRAIHVRFLFSLTISFPHAHVLSNSHVPSVVIASFGDSDTHTSETKFIKASGGLNLGQLHRIHIIYRDVVHDEMGVEEGIVALDRCLKAKPIYPNWLRVIFAGMCAGLICPLGFVPIHSCFSNEV